MHCGSLFYPEQSKTFMRPAGYVYIFVPKRNRRRAAPRVGLSLRI